MTNATGHEDNWTTARSAPGLLLNRAERVHCPLRPLPNCPEQWIHSIGVDGVLLASFTVELEPVPSKEAHVLAPADARRRPPHVARLLPAKGARLSRTRTR